MKGCSVNIGRGGKAYMRALTTPSFASLDISSNRFSYAFIAGADTLSLRRSLPRNLVRRPRAAALSRGRSGGGGGEGGGGGGAGSNSSVGVGAHHGELRQCQRRLPTGSLHFGQESIGWHSPALQSAENFR